MNYLLHRISHEPEISYTLLEKGYLVIGWGILSDQSIINSLQNLSDQNLNNYVINIMINTYSFSPRNRNCLSNFVSYINQGDKIIVPTPGNFAIYEAEGRADLIKNLPDNIIQTLRYQGKPITLNQVQIKNKPLLLCIDGNPDDWFDIGFFIKVKKLTDTVSRWEYADSNLTRIMKYRMTNRFIDDQDEQKCIDNVIYNINNKIKINDLFKTRVSKCFLKSITDCLTPDKMEILVKKYFEKLGAITTIPNTTHTEGDCDIIAEFPQLKLVIFCQVKFHQGETNDYPVDQITAYKNNMQGNGYQGYQSVLWVISSCDKFSDESIVKAEQNNVIIIDGTNFSNMLIDAGVDLNIE